MSALAAVGRRMRLRRRWTAVSRRRVRLLALAAVLAALAALGGWLLFRDSSFVAVDHVSVTGVDGPDAAAITAALDLAARKMTTLDMQLGPLRRAVSGFPEVRDLRVSTRFPHGVVIDVLELVPVAVVHAPGREVAVAGNGTLLPGVPVSASLPVMTVGEPPIGGRLDQPWARAAAQLLAAAPARLLPRLATVTTVAGHGLVVQVRNGPSIYFADASRAAAKWAAAVAVLGDPGSAGASYIDVTDPGRPAAGTDAAVAGAPSSTSSSSTSGGSTSGGAASAGAGASSAGTTAAGSPSTAAPNAPSVSTPTGG